MCGVKGLVPEHSVDGEVLLRREVTITLVIFGQLTKRPCRHSRGVRPEDVPSRLVFAPIVAPTYRAHATLLVHLLDTLEVVHVDALGTTRRLNEESIVRVAGR